MTVLMGSVSNFLIDVFHGTQGLGPNPTINASTIFIIFAKFFYLFILSLILGIAFGLGGAFMLKQCDASSTPQVRFQAATKLAE